ncbi:uncharacterized protein LOC124940333 isoform X2 [Impatiens glandulifera]|uniref:uncharacterized protein LOC124940333 isoform X2 n=1 Tax=Impatiens glandulifera TaxID=253017 RepID=UPI001FB12B61|nr:uncharacterized protein LOC124940333 isoform X2 [Impatiens glandulifera]
MAAAAKELFALLVIIGILLIFSLSTCPVSNAEQVKLTPHFIVPKSGHNSTTPTTKHGAITMPKGELRTHETTRMERINSTNLNIVCTLCEKVTQDILNFLRLEKTKKRIMAILHGSCSLLFNLKPKCIATVNCYGFVFFTLVKITQPRVLCHMVHLCSPSLTNSTTSFMSDDKCEVCRYVVVKALTELTRPNKQLEMIESVMNTCKAMKKNTDEKVLLITL